MSIILDHKHINLKQGDKEVKALGISALITDSSGVQQSLMLDYIPTNSSTAELTTPMLKEILIRFNLLESFKQSKISFSVDGAMLKTVIDLFRDQEMEWPVVTYCQTHNQDNLMKRTVKFNLDEYLPGGSQKFDDLQKLITAAIKDLDTHLRNRPISPGIRNKVIFGLVWTCFLIKLVNRTGF